MPLAAGLIISVAAAAPVGSQSPTATATATAQATASAIASPSPVAATATATSTSTPVPAEKAEILWARAIDPETNEPTRKATAFITTDDVIYAVLPVENVAQGTVFEATWSFNGEVVPALTATVTCDKAYTTGWIEFHLTRSDGEIWPIGEYGIAISSNGEPVADATIQVTVPPS
jgi:hypothetical protein